MITIRDIQASMLKTLSTVFEIKVHRNKINKLSTPAFYIKFISSEHNLWSRKLVDKDILIDIIYYAESESVVESLDVKEKLDSIFMPFFRIKDRALKANYIESKYVDEDLHFMINFKFLDVLEHVHIDDDLIITDKDNEDKEIEYPDGTIETVPMEKMLELYLELEVD